MTPGRKTALAGLAVVLAACGPTQPPPPDAVANVAHQVSCDDAFRFAARALQVRGYHVTAIEKAPGGGRVEGDNDHDALRISLDCAPDGVRVSSSGGLWMEQGIRMTFANFVRLAATPPYPPPVGPKVDLEPLPGVLAKLEFPQELEPQGLTAMHVKAVNGGARAIRIDPRRVQARTEKGGRAGAVDPKRVATKLAGIDSGIEGKLLKAVKLQQGEKAEGFVFFPAGSYSSAVVWVIDDKTGEADEYEVSFAGRPGS